MSTTGSLPSSLLVNPRSSAGWSSIITSPWNIDGLFQRADDEIAIMEELLRNSTIWVSPRAQAKRDEWEITVKKLKDRLQLMKENRASINGLTILKFAYRLQAKVEEIRRLGDQITSASRWAIEEARTTTISSSEFSFVSNAITTSLGMVELDDKSIAQSGLEPPTDPAHFNIPGAHITSQTFRECLMEAALVADLRQIPILVTLDRDPRATFTIFPESVLPPQQLNRTWQWHPDQDDTTTLCSMTTDDLDPDFKS